MVVLYARFTRNQSIPPLRRPLEPSQGKKVQSPKVKSDLRICEFPPFPSFFLALITPSFPLITHVTDLSPLSRPQSLSHSYRATLSRKEQNRLAQRDFRQRKQQCLRALEARVEFVSATHDEQVDRLRFALRALLNENNHLRSLDGTLSGFIGNAFIGGTYARAGISREGSEELLGSTSEKKWTEHWSDWPGSGECEALKESRTQNRIPAEGYSETGESYLLGRKRKEMAEREGEAEEGEGEKKGNGKGKKAKGKEVEKKGKGKHCNGGS